MTQILKEFDTDALRNWLDSFDVVLCDCDGVLWHINKLIPGSDKALDYFKECGKEIFLVTNNALKTTEEFSEGVQQMGYNINKEKIVTVATAALKYLKHKNFNKTVYVVGSSGLEEELKMGGIDAFGSDPDCLTGSFTSYLTKDFKLNPDVGAVIVSIDEHLSFLKLVKAASYLKKEETVFLCTSDEDKYEAGSIVIPLSGATALTLERATGRKPTFLGKPENWLWDLDLKEKCQGKRVLMVGDSVHTDVIFGKRNNCLTLLVGTGNYKPDGSVKFSESETADFYADSLSEVYELLRSKLS